MPAIHGSPISENIDNEFPGIYKNYLVHILLIQTYITTKLSTVLKIGSISQKISLPIIYKFRRTIAIVLGHDSKRILMRKHNQQIFLRQSVNSNYYS